MDATHWPQELGLVKPMEEMMGATSVNTGNQSRPPPLMERRARPQKEKALNCPRCNSTNTKFCYYNNYSLTQPRYFCKTCRRYWTEGGSLRNVPVGGGSRKNKRPSSSSNTGNPGSATLNHATNNNAASISNVSSSSGMSNHGRKFMHEAHDLNLAFPHSSLVPDQFSFPSLESSSVTGTNTGTVGAISAMELLRSGTIGAGGLGPGFMPVQMQEYTTGYDFRVPSSLGFSLDATIGAGNGVNTSSVGTGFVGMQSVQETGTVTGSRLLFPFHDSKPLNDQNGNKEQGMFWNAMMGGGGGGATGGETGEDVNGGGGASW
ncbi:hypothetical protein LUZ60_016429 [Juncus effusus]|nr:hypothetical protein LUZ60_016429 [Juncus effusus]